MAALEERRALGARGPDVSRLCLGTMMFGGPTDAAEAGEIVAAFREAGGNSIDTADTYNAGRSERIVGDLIRDDRDAWVVATKLGNPVEGVPGSGGLKGGYFARALEASLDRLGTDRIDLYYLHLDDEDTPLEETLEALGLALADGRIRAWGFSNYRAWKIAEMIRLADAMGVARPIAAQPYYHALYRQIEIDYLPACAHFGIGVVPYSPLARGVLTGKYAGGAAPDGSRAARGDARIAETEMRPEVLEAAAAFHAHVAPSGRASGDVALQWVLANRIVSSVLIGPRTLEQTRAYLAAMACPFGPEDEAAVDRLAPSGAVIGAWSDPKYPYRGRVAG
jgi:aryl-alcohol dehydrogenase-like predicted oxidoreductase